MAFFKRVHITAEQQIENPRVVSEIQDAVIAEAIEAGHSITPDIHFGNWWKLNKGFNGFKTVRAAKAVHTAFDKRECGDDPNFFLFIRDSLIVLRISLFIYIILGFLQQL